MSDLSLLQIEEFKAALQKQRVALSQQIESKTRNSDDTNFTTMTGADVRDPGEESMALQMANFNISALEKQMGELNEIEAALRRIDQGIYGKCFECDCVIPYARLKAYPAATCCTACQARLESAHGNLTPSL